MLVRSTWRVATVLITALALTACGKKASKGGSSGPKVGKVEGAFLKAAAETGIPARFMMAAGYVESRLSPEHATAKYVTTADDNIDRGTLLTETAFGRTLEALELDADKEQSALLETQIPAYARWLQKQFKSSGVKLPAEAKTPEDKFRWVEALSVLHRDGSDVNRRNVEILFARELIQTLNEGFFWQDTRGEKLELQKENPPIDITKFPEDGKSWFKLDEDSADIPDAMWFSLATVNPREFENKPRHVEVIHCPLSLSACLELQTRTKESNIRLAAHYIIPPIPEEKREAVYGKPLQVTRHSYAVTLTDRQGEDVVINDAIVIMLVGNSGRLVKGSRHPAIPTWFTDFQLRAMGRVISSVCTLLAEQNPNEVNAKDCMSTNDKKGVRFRSMTGQDMRWGDIADFDPAVFEAYLRSTGGLDTQVKFTFNQPSRQFKAGEDIALNLTFGSAVRSVVLERMNRCRNGKVVWESVETQKTQGKTKAVFTKTFYDGGPNQNGDQFFRARAIGKDGRLMGWSIDQVYLQKYQPEPEYPAEGCGDEED